MTKRMIKGYLFVILSAILYGCMPIMAQYVKSEGGVNSMTLVFLRAALSSPVLAILALLTKKTLSVPPKAIPGIALIGLLGGALTPALLFVAYDKINSGTVTVLQFVYPAVVVIFGFLFWKKKVGGATLLSVLFCLCGIVFFFDPTTSNTNFPLGATLAIAAGVAYALYILFLSEFRYKEKASGFLFAFYVALSIAIAMGLFCLVSGQFDFPDSPKGWLLSFGFAVIINVGAAVLFQQGTFIIGGERASVLSAVEPTTSFVVGLSQGEKQPSLAFVGAVIVIGAGVFIALADIREAKKKKE